MPVEIHARRPAARRCSVCSSSVSLRWRSSLEPDTGASVSFPLVSRYAICEMMMSSLVEEISIPLKSVGRNLQSGHSKRFSIRASVGRSDSGIATSVWSVQRRMAIILVWLWSKLGSKMDCCRSGTFSKNPGTIVLCQYSPASTSPYSWINPCQMWLRKCGYALNKSTGGFI